MVPSSELVVASWSFAELGTAQPQLVLLKVSCIQFLANNLQDYKYTTMKVWKSLTNHKQFLAAMSSSRSDVVTQSVRSCVCPFFSFSVLGILSSLKVFQWCFKKVLRVFEFSRMFPVSLKGVYKKFQGNFKGISIKFRGCFKLVYREFQVISRGFQGYLKEV